MKLKYLTKVDGDLANTEITGITCDSRQVKPGYLFVCIKGAASDGHEYAAQAVIRILFYAEKQAGKF